MTLAPKPTKEEVPTSLNMRLYDIGRSINKQTPQAHKRRSKPTKEEEELSFLEAPTSLTVKL